jgi:hypothetical protein
MYEITAIYGALLFILLTPGLIVRIPQRGSLLSASIVHGIIFAILYYSISRIVFNYTKENFTEKSEKYKGNAYCMKCKSKKDFIGIIVINKGYKMAKGKCSKCSTNMTRLLGKMK